MPSGDASATDLLVAIVGPGRIGAGLARRLASQSRPPILVDAGDDFAALGAAGAIVEAVPEDLALKRAVLTEVRRHAPATPVLSTTSSLLPDDLLPGDALLGLWHPFAPLSRRLVVEIATAPGADPAVTATAVRLAVASRRRAATVALTPGLVGNRLLKHVTHAGVEAWGRTGAMVEVEQAFVAAGFPLGPNAIVDLVGVPTSWAVSARFAQGLGPRYAPPEALERLARDPAARERWHAALTRLPEPAQSSDPTLDPPLALDPLVAQALTRVRTEIGVLIDDQVADPSTIAVICREGLGWTDALLRRLGLPLPTDASPVRNADTPSP